MIILEICSICSNRSGHSITIINMWFVCQFVPEFYEILSWIYSLRYSKTPGGLLIKPQAACLSECSDSIHFSVYRFLAHIVFFQFKCLYIRILHVMSVNKRVRPLWFNLPGSSLNNSCFSFSESYNQKENLICKPSHNRPIKRVGGGVNKSGRPRTRWGGGVGHRPDVHKRKKLHFGVHSGSTMDPPPPSTDVRIAIFLAFRTFMRDTIRTSVKGGEGGSSKRTMLVYKGGDPKSPFLLGRHPSMTS